MGDDIWEFEQDTVLVGFGFNFSETFALQISAGAIVEGSMRAQQLPARSHRHSPGGLVSLGITWHAVAQSAWPYIELTATFGISFFETRVESGPEADRQDFTATDQRLAMTAGYRLWDRWTIYLSGRVFASPFWWRAQGIDLDGAGTDANKFAVAAGTSLDLPGGVILYADFAALGERTLTAGLAYRWDRPPEKEIEGEVDDPLSDDFFN